MVKGGAGDHDAEEKEDEEEEEDEDDAIVNACPVYGPRECTPGYRIRRLTTSDLIGR